MDIASSGTPAPENPTIATTEPGVEADARRPTRWLVAAFFALLMALGWLAGGDHVAASLLGGPAGECGGP